MTFPFGDIVTEGLQKSGYHSIITKGETQNPSKIKNKRRILTMSVLHITTATFENEVLHSDKPVLLDFWASWCGPCKSEMDDFEQAYQELGEDVQFLMVNMTDGSRETVDTASDSVAEQGYTFPVYFDTQSDAALTYSVYSLPSTYFIDAEGGAVARAVGAIDRDTLQTGIDMILP